VFSEENIDILARKNKFIERSRKITGSAFIKTLVFNEEEHEQLSLLDLKCDLFEHTGCQVSQEAIHKRFTPEAVLFLKEVFSQQLKGYLSPGFSSGLDVDFFSNICIKDSTKFSLPVSYINSYPSYKSFNKSSSLMNIQYEYDLITGEWHSLELTKATRNDQADSKETVDRIIEGSLNIRDLGYITTTYLKAFESNHAYYLNRLPKIGVYQKNGQEYKLLNWEVLDKKMKKGGFKQLELDVYLGKEDKLKTRMVIYPVPIEVANKRIRKANQGGKRSDGYQISKEYKIKAQYNIFITNVQEEILPAAEINNAYRLRWQIELIFKAWKSNLKIHKVKAVKKERMECQLIAKLIWILLNSKLLSIANMILRKEQPDQGCSPIKFFKRAKIFSQTLMNTINNHEQFFNWYKTSVIPIIPYLVIEKRKDEKTHCQILNDIFAN